MMTAPGKMSPSRPLIVTFPIVLTKSLARRNLREERSLLAQDGYLFLWQESQGDSIIGEPGAVVHILVVRKQRQDPSLRGNHQTPLLYLGPTS